MLFMVCRELVVCGVECIGGDVWARLPVRKADPVRARLVFCYSSFDSKNDVFTDGVAIIASTSSGNASHSFATRVSESTVTSELKSISMVRLVLVFMALIREKPVD